MRVLFPGSNLSTAKRRLALVVQAESLRAGMAQTIVAMITSNQARARHPSRVAVAQLSLEERTMGLLNDSVVMTENLATILDSEIDRVIGRCTIMPAVDGALRYTPGLRNWHKRTAGVLELAAVVVSEGHCPSLA